MEKLILNHSLSQESANYILQAMLVLKLKISIKLKIYFTHEIDLNNQLKITCSIRKIACMLACSWLQSSHDTLQERRTVGCSVCLLNMHTLFKASPRAKTFQACRQLWSVLQTSHSTQFQAQHNYFAKAIGPVTYMCVLYVSEVQC